MIVIYRRGLKENIKDELIRSGGVIDTLDGLIEEVIETNDKLFERSIEKRYNSRTSGIGRSTFFAKSRNYRYNKREQRDPYRHIPIELDFINQGPTRGPRKKHFKGKKQQGGKKILTYYSYGKPGYFARDYRSKNMVQRPQLNILERVQSQDAIEKAPTEDLPI